MSVTWGGQTASIILTTPIPVEATCQISVGATAVGSLMAATADIANVCIDVGLGP